jgi:hypothetical protein
MWPSRRRGPPVAVARSWSGGMAQSVALIIIDFDQFDAAQICDRHCRARRLLCRASRPGPARSNLADNTSAGSDCFSSWSPQTILIGAKPSDWPDSTPRRRARRRRRAERTGLSCCLRWSKGGQLIGPSVSSRRRCRLFGSSELAPDCVCRRVSVKAAAARRR